MCCKCNELHDEVDTLKAKLDKLEKHIRKDFLEYSIRGSSNKKNKINSDILQLKQQRKRIDELLNKYEIK